MIKTPVADTRGMHHHHLRQTDENERPTSTSGKIAGGPAILGIGTLIAGGMIAVSWFQNMFHIMGAQPSAADMAAFDRSLLWATGVFGVSIALAMLAQRANRSSSADE